MTLLFIQAEIQATLKQLFKVNGLTVTRAIGHRVVTGEIKETKLSAYQNINGKESPSHVILYKPTTNSF